MNALKGSGSYHKLNSIAHTTDTLYVHNRHVMEAQLVITTLLNVADRWTEEFRALHAHHLSRGKSLMKRIMLMKVKETRMSISHSSQLTDFFVCCSKRSDSVFSFSKFKSA